MTTIMPTNQQLKQAVKWISEQLKDNESKSAISLVNEAILRFDLDPKQSEYLLNFYRKK
jgi:hypothetical protein